MCDSQDNVDIRQSQSMTTRILGMSLTLTAQESPCKVPHATAMTERPCRETGWSFSWPLLLLRLKMAELIPSWI